MGQEVVWTFSSEKEEEKKKGWTFSTPSLPPQERVVVDKIRTSARGLEAPKRPGPLPALGSALKKTAQQIVSPVEGAIRMAAGIPAWMAGTATTVGAQPFVGWEKAGEIGQKVSGVLSGGQTRLGGEQTENVEEMLSPLAAPFSIALEKGPEALAPGEPGTQAMLGSGMGLALILSPKLGITPKTLVREAKMKFWKDKTIPAKQRAAIVSELNKAEAVGAKTIEDWVEYDRQKEAAHQGKLEDLSRQGKAEAKANWGEFFDTLKPPTPEQMKIIGAEAKPKASKTTPPAVPKTLAEQGKALMGEPRGGSILPTQELPKRVGPINLERLNLEFEPKRVYADAEDFLHRKRMQDKEKGTWSASEEQAKMYGGAYEIGQALGKSAEEVISDFAKSTDDLPAKVEATRNVMATSAQRVTDLARAWIENPTEENAAKVQIARQQHIALQYYGGGGTSNIARALNIHKKTLGAKDILLTKGAKKVLETIGKDTLDTEAIHILAALDSSNPSSTLKFLAEHKPATFRQKAFELWMNSILSNPLTHNVNMTSNLGTMLWRAVEDVGGATLESIRYPLAKTGAKLGIVKNLVQKDVYFGEAAYSVIGAFRGLKDGLKISWEKLKGGLTADDITKLEIPTHAIKGKKGEVVRIPSKALGAEDAFFKTTIYSGKIYSEAYKAATREGLRGEARKAKIAELVQNPTDHMKAVAKQESLYLTFNNELGELGKAVMHLRQRVPGLEFIIPFVRTPTNIAKFGVQRTLLGMPSAIRESIRAELPMGEMQKRTFSIGATTGASIILAKMVIDGSITGSGPTDKRERDMLYAQGWQPRSIKIGEKYYGYGRVEPFSTILGLYADFHDIRQHATGKEANKIAGLIGTSLKNNLLDKTFFSGLMDLIKGTEDVERYGGNLVNRLAGSVVPASVAGAARAIDPNLREARSIINTIKSRVPGLSQTLAPKMGPFGEPAKRPGTPLSRMISPVPVSKEVRDTVYTELNRLGMSISKPVATIKGKRLGDKAQRKLAEQAMPEVKAMALKVISSPLYRSLKTDEEKKKVLKSYMNRTRAFQRGIFILEQSK